MTGTTYVYMCARTCGPPPPTPNILLQRHRICQAHCSAAEVVLDGRAVRQVAGQAAARPDNDGRQLSRPVAHRAHLRSPSALMLSCRCCPSLQLQLMQRLRHSSDVHLLCSFDDAPPPHGRWCYFCRMFQPLVCFDGCR